MDAAPVEHCKYTGTASATGVAIAGMASALMIAILPDRERINRRNPMIIPYDNIAPTDKVWRAILASAFKQ